METNKGFKSLYLHKENVNPRHHRVNPGLPNSSLPRPARSGLFITSLAVTKQDRLSSLIYASIACQSTCCCGKTPTPHGKILDRYSFFIERCCCHRPSTIPSREKCATPPNGTVPPEPPVILDRWGRVINSTTIGPKEEGDDLLLTCRVVGGNLSKFKSLLFIGYYLHPSIHTIPTYSHSVCFQCRIYVC